MHQPGIVALVVCLLGVEARGAATGQSPSDPKRTTPAPVQAEAAQFSLKALDLSRPPTVDELVAAGQLGGPLTPTHDLEDRGRDEAARRDFGAAIEAWNRHEYVKGGTLFRRHAADFPDSPWAGEALLHVGCDATYNGRYSEAEAVFRQLIAENQVRNHAGARLLLAKARQRLGVLKVEQNNLVEANELFRAMVKESPDWRHRTYASHWIQRLSRYRGAQQALLSCGVEALAYVMDKEGRSAAASQVRTNRPATMQGHSLSALMKLAGACGWDLAAIAVDTAKIIDLPLPAILHITPKNDGDTGHYWVLDKAGPNQVELYDPQSGQRFHQTPAELAREWSGRALVRVKGGTLPGRRLNPSEIENTAGSCCGAPRPEDDQGDPCKRKGATSTGSPPTGGGAPSWKVNTLNMNLYVKDTPIWYEPPAGPMVQITLNYNSQSAIAYHEPFGNKWHFNLGGYLVVDTAGSVVIFMADGRRDVFNPDGAGGYVQPYRVHNKLTKIAENHFELRYLDDTVYVFKIPPGTTSQQPFLVEIRDVYGQKLTLGYNTDVRLTTITDALGKLTRLSYDASGLVTNVADPFGRSASFDYDANRNLTKITDMAGYWSSFTYDANVNLTSIGNERGTTTFLIEPADDSGQNSDNYPPPGDPMWENYRITVTNPLGETDEFFYYGGCDEFTCRGYTWHVSPRYYVPWQSQQINTYRLDVPKTRYFFEQTGTGRRGEIVRVRQPDGSETSYEYDTTSGERTSVSDAHGHTMQYRYNEQGLVTSFRNGSGALTTYIYATNGIDLLSVTNSLGQTRYTYNPQHRMVSRTDRLGQVTTRAYNARGQVVSTSDALGVVRSNLYDADLRLVEIQVNGEMSERFTYDAVGRVRTHTRPNGVTVTNEYNLLNQLVRVSYPDGGSESFVYSTCCPRLFDSYTDRAGRTTRYQYDALRRRTQRVDSEGNVTRYRYDGDGNQVEAIDPNGNPTRFEYTVNDQLARKVFVNGTGVSFGYDEAGLLVTRTNARGIVTFYGYDGDHRLTSIRYSDGTPGMTNTYDALGRITQTRDAIGVTVYTYDVNSQLRSADGPYADDTITWQYDALGRRTNVIVGSGPGIGYRYDRLGRLVSVQAGNSSYTYGFNGNSPAVQSLTRPNGSETLYEYDSLNRLLSVANRRSGGALINRFLHTFGTQDLRATETITNDLLTHFTQAQRVTYTYDSLNQLLASTSPDRTYTHDADGNLTRGFTPAGEVWTATYDAEDRLATLTYTTQSAVAWRMTYTYSGQGLLARVRTFRNEVLTDETRYLRESHLPLEQRNAANQVVRSFVWGLHWGGGIAGLLQVTQGGVGYSCIYDAKGNVVGLLDGAQNAVAAYVYDPFGALVAKAGTVDQPFRFSTMPYDEGTGLAAFAYRYYAPTLGRWLSRDPAGERQDLNPYAFVGNNPIHWVDPLGMWGTAGPSDPALNTIVCDGNGGIRVQMGTANPSNTDPCVMSCIGTHEQFHAQTAQKASPNICQGKANGTQLVYTDSGEQRPDEVAASEAEINCLNRAKESGCKDCNAASMDARITQMEGYRDSFK